MKLRKKKVFIVVIALLILSVIVAVGYQHIRSTVKTVKEISVSKGKIAQEVYASGRLELSDKQELYAPFEANVKNVNVQVGDHVNAGQVLLEMDAEDLNKQIEAAAITLAESQSELKQAKLTRTNSLADLKKTMDDYLSLNNPDLGQDGKPSLSMEQMEANYAKAKQDYERLLNNPDSNGDTSLSTLENKVKEDQIALNELQEKRNSAVVTSPIDGIVVSLNAVPGGPASGAAASNGTSSVSSGGSLVTIADFSKLNVKAKVNEMDSPQVKVGQKVTVNGDAVNKDYAGTVSRIAPTAVTATGTKGEETTVEILVNLDNPSGLKPGYNVSANIKTLEKDHSLLLPPQAIQEQNGQNIVFVDENGLAKQHDITVGISDETHVEILSGLKEGDKVIIEDNLDLKDGDQVKANG